MFYIIFVPKHTKIDTLFNLDSYIDDIVVFSKTWDDHVKHVEQVLDTLQKEKFCKCEFGKTSLVYLGHIFGGGQLIIYLSKVEVTLKWPKPTNATEVRRLLGEI